MWVKDSSDHFLNILINPPETQGGSNSVPAFQQVNFTLNPLTPKNDKHLISPYNITLESHIKIRRMKEMITSWRLLIVNL